MVKELLNTQLKKEIIELLYLKLKDNKNGELCLDEILELIFLKTESKLDGLYFEVIKLMGEKKDVIQLKDEKKGLILKLA